MEVRNWNRDAWNRKVRERNRWTVPVSSADVARARNGDWQIFLTSSRPVPANWFPKLHGSSVLCLASGGGQQGPLLAAAGARVTIFDNSPSQLEQDILVAERDGLDITTSEGDMADLSRFADESFDLIVHPCSNCFVPDVRPVWRESFRVLKHSGVLLSGFVNPVVYLFTEEDCANGKLTVTQRLPWSDLESRNSADVQRRLAAGEPFEFGHLLGDQIGGQIDAGFLITGFYEDGEETEEDALSKFTPWMIATRALKPTV